MAFRNLMPAGYDYSRAQINQYADIVPNFRLPTGRTFYIHTGKENWTYPLMRAKGLTNYELLNEGYELRNGGTPYSVTFPGESFQDVPRINDQFGMTTSTSKEQCEAFARQLNTNIKLRVFETQEQINYLPAEAIQWKWFYDELERMYIAAKAIDGKPYKICHNYFHFAGGIFAPGEPGITRELVRRLYTTAYENWPSITYTDQFGVARNATNQFSPGQSQHGTNLILSAIYVDTPDTAARLYAGALFDMDVARMQGKSGGGYFFDKHEWRPNWREQTIYSDGTFVRTDKMKISVKALISMAFHTQEFGDTTIQWSKSQTMYQPVSKKPMSYFAEIHDNDHWRPNSDPTNDHPFPYYGNTSPGNYAFGGGSDFIGFGVELWNSTMGQVHTATPKFLRYKIGSGPWIEPSASGSDLVDCIYDHRGFVRARKVGNKIGLIYQDFFADNTRKTILFEHPDVPGTTFTRSICGSGVHVELITI